MKILFYLVYLLSAISFFFAPYYFSVKQLSIIVGIMLLIDFLRNIMEELK